MHSSNNAPPVMPRKKVPIDMNKVYERINNRINQLGGSLIQTNGQRVYSSTDCPEESAKGCEIFVGKIPRDVFEDELLDKLEVVGKILKLRLMMDFNGQNRGYAFVTYQNAEIANLAVCVLHNSEVRPGRRLGIYKSIDNCRLFVGGIPLECSRREVHEALAQYVDGIKEVIMYPSHSNKKLNRGFVFIEFEEHRMAALARRKLSPGSLVMWGVPILVDWAEPLPDVDPSVMSRVTNLYIRNLDVSLTQDALLAFLERFVSRKDILRVHKTVDYAFIHLASRRAAEEAFDALKDATLYNEPIEIMWARPRMYSKLHRTGIVQDHFCSSLPPKCRKQIQEARELNKGKANPHAKRNVVDNNVKVELPKPIGPPAPNYNFFNPAICPPPPQMKVEIPMQPKIEAPIPCRNFNIMFQHETLPPFIPQSYQLTNVTNGFRAPEPYYYGSKFFHA